MTFSVFGKQILQLSTSVLSKSDSQNELDVELQTKDFDVPGIF